MEEQKNTNEKVNWNIRPYLAIGLTAFLVIVGSLSFFFLIDRYHGFTAIVGKMIGILQPITIGLVIAYLMTPIVNFEERHLLSGTEENERSTEGKETGKSRQRAWRAYFLCIDYRRFAADGYTGAVQ